MLGALRAEVGVQRGEQIQRVSAEEALRQLTALALTPMGSRRDRGAGDVLA